MNIHLLLLSAAVVGGIGCGPPEPPVAPGPAPPTPAVVIEKRQALIGLPLRGSQIEVLGDIEFDTSSATIRQTPQTIGILTTLANAGRTYPQISRLRIEGHTDSDGDEGANQDLSERRSRAVMQWLVEHGIEPSRVSASGCGSRVPVVPNTTTENKQRNRRTEFYIEEVEGRRFELANAACTPNPVRASR